MVTKDAKTGTLTFILTGKSSAKQVYLVGDFNGWNATARRMVKIKDGSFRAKVELSPGSYEYKFVVDGEWIVDADAAAQKRNAYGTANSVVTV